MRLQKQSLNYLKSGPNDQIPKNSNNTVSKSEICSPAITNKLLKLCHCFDQIKITHLCQILKLEDISRHSCLPSTVQEITNSEKTCLIDLLINLIHSDQLQAKIDHRQGILIVVGWKATNLENYILLQRNVNSPLEFLVFFPNWLTPIFSFFPFIHE